MKGSESGSCVLCTSTHTYNLKRLETSNYMLLLAPNDPSSEAREMKAVADARSTFEIAECVPDLSAVREVLERNRKAHEAQDDGNAHDPLLSSGVSMDHLLEAVPASEAEIRCSPLSASLFSDLL